MQGRVAIPQVAGGEEFAQTIKGRREGSARGDLGDNANAVGARGLKGRAGYLPRLLLPKKRPALVDEAGGGGFCSCDAVGARDWRIEYVRCMAGLRARWRCVCGGLWCERGLGEGGSGARLFWIAVEAGTEWHGRRERKRGVR